MTAIDEQAIADVAVALASSDPADLLPARRAAEAARIEQPLRVVAAARYGARPFYAVLLEDGRGERYGGPMVMEDGRLRRARAGEGASSSLIEDLRTNVTVTGLRSSVYDAERWPVSSAQDEHAITVDQTNDLVALGRHALVKWMLHPAGGEDVASSHLTFLTLNRFGHAPRPWANADLIIAASQPPVMARIVTIVDFIPDAEDGWDWAVRDVRALARGEISMVQALAPVLELGSITARMHICLSESQAHTATAEDVQTWVRWFEQDLEASGISGDLVDEVRRALPTIEMAIGTPISAIHGDYHVGQILRSASTPGAAARYVVVDFDGSPLLTPAERTLQQPPARDVASMLASLDHVGRVVLHRTEDLTDHQRSTVLQWIDRSQSVLLAAYLAELDHAGKLEFANARLTAAFQVQQELREHAYARRYLPHWHYVPDAALPALIARQRGDSRES